MMYDAKKYVGKSIQLYPGDTIAKYGKIVDLDDLGWTIKITSTSNNRHYHDYSFEEGETYFISHSKNFTFRFIED